MTDYRQWWQEARYGMFIHWGVYSIPARGEWVMYQEHIPHEEYAPFASQFDPKKYDPDAWVQLAKDAGMRYMVLTTRHHDGYSLFDSQHSDFTAPRQAAKRDLIREYVEACHRGGMRVGFYYSLLDWRYSAYFDGPEKDPEGWAELVEYVHGQVRELCTNYGKIDILWYDGGWPYTAADWRSEQLNAMVRSLQPEIMINNRAQTPEDFGTPEQHIQAAELGRLWEACMTLNDSWGYNAADNNWKSPKQVVMNLARCASGGGNFLLNVGPKPDGTIPEKSIRILKTVGRWLDKNSGAIYGTTRSEYRSSTGFSAVKGNSVYIHVVRWPGKELTLCGLKNRVQSVHLLQTGRQVEFEQQDDRLFMHGLPKRAPNDLDTVIVVELDGKPRAIDYFKDGWAPVHEVLLRQEIAEAEEMVAAEEEPTEESMPRVEVPEEPVDEATEEKD